MSSDITPPADENPWERTNLYNSRYPVSERPHLNSSISYSLPALELMAVIKGLEAIKEPCIVELYSDSRYVIDALRLGWARKWKSNNWVRSGNAMAANADLWDKLLDLVDRHTVHYHWVKGHASNVYNNRCDELAVQQRLLLK